MTTNGQSQCRPRPWPRSTLSRSRRPGRRFEEARVEGLTVSTNCGSGIFVLATAFSALMEGNTALRNGSTVAGAACGGI